MQPRPESTDSDFDKPAAPNPAANALKHGFCASKILSPETLARADAIRDELAKIHEPWSAEEDDAIAQLALARAQQFDLELAMHRKATDEKARAAELYERTAQDRFHADLARFRENPALFGSLPGMTWHGADWLEKLWRQIAGELAPDPAGNSACLPFALACEAAAALGSPWQVDLADAEAGWFMARWIRIAPDPDAALELWVDRSKALDGLKFARSRAKKFLDQAPADPGEAATELAARTNREYERWSLQARALRTNYETARDTAAEAAVGTGSGDARLEKEFRLLSRYLTSARNRADRLQRRLDGLKKDRKALAYRAQRDAEREARKLKKASEKAMRQFECESARIERERAAFYASPESPEYENDELDSRAGEFAACAYDPGMKSMNTSSEGTGIYDPPGPGVAMQDFEKSHDTCELRNDIPADDGADDSAADNGNRTAKPAAEEERGGAAWLERTTPLKDRVRMMRYRDWSDPREVFDDEADLLKQIVALPESFEREFTIQAFFGSAKVMRRCWKAYCSWAMPESQAR
ncbi:hypothetical protein GC170_03000 [bacterium]|nr:hypothetical protein [bacterium]